MRHRWLYDLLVLALVAYFVAGAVTGFFEARLTPDPVIESVAVKAAEDKSSTSRPLKEYTVISERNLFGGEAAGTPPPPAPPAEEVIPEDLPEASKSLGLKLVGTVVATGPSHSLAIIENSSTRKQEGYHEGDRVKKALIKKIRRYSVVINTGKRDEILTMEPEETKGQARAPARKVKKPTAKPARGGTIQLEREELESALADLNQLMQQVQIQPYKEGNKPGGFMVSKIRPGSLFTKMGLRNGDVIQRVNDEVISDTEQAIELYESLLEGGEVALDIKRGRRKQRLVYEIQ
jgi:general secretion pathway protein C